MKTRTLLLALAALSACRHRAHSDPRAWRWENPTPQGNRLNAACLDAQGRAYAVGDFGTILTREGNGAWRAAPLRARTELRAVACGAGGVYAVGAGGLALRTRDGGARWYVLPVGVRANLNAVTTHGTTVLLGGDGGVVLRATDGETFRPTLGADGVSVTGLWTDGRAAVAVGPGGATLRSDDGGARWRRVESGTQRTLTAVGGSGADDLYAVGTGGTVLVSGDGGARWTVLPRSGEDDLRAVASRGRRDVYAVGAAGVVLHSRDGVQFIREDSTAPGDLLGLALRGDEALAVGVRGAITARESSGRWRLLPGGHRGSLHSVWRGADGRACAAGQGGAILCRDPALGWVPMPSGMRANLGGIASDGAGVYVSVGDYGTVLRSTDHGQNWTLLPTGENGTLEPGDTSPTWAQLPTRQNRALSAVWLGRNGSGLIVGRDAIVLRTTDHGARWSRVRHEFRAGLLGVWAMEDGRAWACGVGGILLRSDDAGAHWRKLESGTTQDLFAAWSDGRETWIVGRVGGVLRSTDGEHFARVDAGVTDTLLSVTGHGRDVWIAAVGGRLFHTRSRGARWDLASVGTGDDFTAVYAAPDGRASLVGYWGTVLALE